METEKISLIQNNINSKRRAKLNYIAFIKFLAMIKLIKWHIYSWKSKPIDYGARMCEILFIASGFLVGYNYYKRNMPCDYKTSFNYSYKHLRTFYPLEFIVTIYGFCNNQRKKYNLTTFEILIGELLMIKSWSRYKDLAAYFNGISWFLSVLLFCYFLVPILLQGIKNLKISFILFFIVAFIRVATEEVILNGSINFFDAHFHRGPIIRLLEFYIWECY